MLRFFRRKSGPPSASDVASRALILKWQIVTGLTVPPAEALDPLSTSWSPAEREQVLEEHRQRQARLAQALKDAGIWSAMSSRERAFVLASPARIDAQTLRDVSWSMESAECLLWALGCVERLPPYDAQADVDDLTRLPSDGLAAWIESATLRDAGLISAARDIAELWHWRSRTYQLQQSGHPIRRPDNVALTDVVRMAAEKAAADGLFETPIEGDFPAFGRAYARLTPNEWSEATSIAAERHKALNWLCGYAPSNEWEKTPTHT